MNKTEPTDLCVLVGSIRADSYSLRTGNLVADIAARAGLSCALIDPRALKLGIPNHPDDNGQAATNASELQAQIKSAKVIVFVTPEYDGSYSAVSKVLIEHLGYPSALFGKFISIVGVASGLIGADRAIDHLRSVLMHIGAIVMPNNLSLAEVHKWFAANGDPDQVLVDKLEKLLGALKRAI